MKKNYIIINLETNGYFNAEDTKQIIFLEALKIDENFKVIAKYQKYIKPTKELTAQEIAKTGITNEMLKNAKSENSVIKEFIAFCQDCNIITHNAKFELPFLLKALYKNQITNNFTFWYIDIKDMLKKYKVTKLTIDTYIEVIKNYLHDYSFDNLNDLFHDKRIHRLLFRGLNYPKYLCHVLVNDKKYYGYIIDFSKDKNVSYQATLKELKGEYFSTPELEKLKTAGAKVIMNFHYLNETSVSFIDYFFVQVHDESKISIDYFDIIEGVKKFHKYNHDHKQLKVILWGNKRNLQLLYKYIRQQGLNEIVSAIVIMKEPWDYWTDEELKILEGNLT